MMLKGRKVYFLKNFNFYTNSKYSTLFLLILYVYLLAKTKVNEANAIKKNRRDL